MKKHILVGLLVLCLAAPLTARASAAELAPAIPNASTVLVNGKSVAFDAYTIDSSNYFKLRDLAYALNGDPKGFEVVWDRATASIHLLPGQPYTSDGQELASGDGTSKPYLLNSAPLYVDGRPVSLVSYTINGNNYFKLRDIMKLLNVAVGWDGATSTITIDTSGDYVVPPPSFTAKEVAIRDLALPLVGKRYALGGSDPASGFDCSGLSYYIWKQLGVAIPRTGNAQLDGAKGTKLKPGDTVRVGDIVRAPAYWMMDQLAALPLHGIYLGNGQVLSSADGFGVCLLENVTQVTEAVRYSKNTEATQDPGLQVVTTITDPNALVLE